MLKKKTVIEPLDTDHIKLTAANAMNEVIQSEYNDWIIFQNETQDFLNKNGERYTMAIHVSPVVDRKDLPKSQIILEQRLLEVAKDALMAIDSEERRPKAFELYLSPVQQFEDKRLKPYTLFVRIREFDVR